MKGTVKESKSVTDTPQYFEQDTQTNHISVRGDPALPGSLYVISPCILLDFESYGLNDCKGTLSFLFGFGIASTGKRA